MKIFYILKPFDFVFCLCFSCLARETHENGRSTLRAQSSNRSRKRDRATVYLDEEVVGFLGSCARTTAFSEGGCFIIGARP